LLNSEKIEYLLIGGYAVALYGYVRPTKDMDVWVSVAPENLDRLIHALTKFGFAPGSIPRTVFTGPQTVFRMGFPPNRLEILTSISGISFADAFPRRVLLNIDGIDVPVISYEDLKRNKSASDRLSDRADVEQLAKAEARRNKKPS
jgi:hypothetical protein